MASPISRGEVSQMEERILSNVMSTAMAIEALETILVAKGLLKDDELMVAVADLLKSKKEQAGAAAVSPLEVT